MYRPEKFFADFADLNREPEAGVLLHDFYKRIRTRVPVRQLLEVLNELIKEGLVVVTACNNKGRQVGIKLLLTEWLLLTPHATDKMYFNAKSGRWFDAPEAKSTSTYNNFRINIL